MRHDNNEWKNEATIQNLESFEMPIILGVMGQIQQQQQQQQQQQTQPPLKIDIVFFLNVFLERTLWKLFTQCFAKCLLQNVFRPGWWTLENVLLPDNNYFWLLVVIIKLSLADCFFMCTTFEEKNMV